MTRMFVPCEMRITGPGICAGLALLRQCKDFNARAMLVFGKPFSCPDFEIDCQDTVDEKCRPRSGLNSSECALLPREAGRRVSPSAPEAKSPGRERTATGAPFRFLSRLAYPTTSNIRPGADSVNSSDHDPPTLRMHRDPLASAVNCLPELQDIRIRS